MTEILVMGHPLLSLSLHSFLVLIDYKSNMCFSCEQKSRYAKKKKEEIFSFEIIARILWQKY
jgi:hypothetical protein